MANLSKNPPGGIIPNIEWCIAWIKQLIGRSFASSGGGGGTTPTLDQVLVASSNITTQAIKSTAAFRNGVTTGVLPYDSIYLGPNIAQGDSSGNLKLHNLADPVTGIYNAAIQLQANNNAVNCHFSYGPSTQSIVDDVGIFVTTGTSYLKVGNVSGNFVKVTPLTIQFDKTNLNTLAFVDTTANRTWTLPDLTGTIGVNNSVRATGQVAANSSFQFVAVPALDTTYMISSIINVTTSTTYSFNVQVQYTDETNTVRTQTLAFQTLAGLTVTAIANAGGAVPYASIPIPIRCKASSTITWLTTGTFTSVVYNAEGIYQQVA